MRVGNRELQIVFDHVLMLSAGDRALPSERTETLD
jgi:hypothetical protein